MKQHLKYLLLTTALMGGASAQASNLKYKFEVEENPQPKPGSWIYVHKTDFCICNNTKKPLYLETIKIFYTNDKSGYRLSDEKSYSVSHYDWHNSDKGCGFDASEKHILLKEGHHLKVEVEGDLEYLCISSLRLGLEEGSYYDFHHHNPHQFGDSDYYRNGVSFFPFNDENTSSINYIHEHGACYNSYEDWENNKRTINTTDNFFPSVATPKRPAEVKADDGDVKKTEAKNGFKVLSIEEIQKLDFENQIRYAEELSKWEESQSKKGKEAKGKKDNGNDNSQSQEDWEKQEKKLRNVKASADVELGVKGNKTFFKQQKEREKKEQQNIAPAVGIGPINANEKNKFNVTPKIELYNNKILKNITSLQGEKRNNFITRKVKILRAKLLKNQSEFDENLKTDPIFRETFLELASSVDSLEEVMKKPYDLNYLKEYKKKDFKNNIPALMDKYGNEFEKLKYYKQIFFVLMLGDQDFMTIYAKELQKRRTAAAKPSVLEPEKEASKRESALNGSFADKVSYLCVTYGTNFEVLLDMMKKGGDLEIFSKMFSTYAKDLK